ncbi:MAG: hypothetical protein HY675_04930 [Chloroflexi bacterium]|nr:hypothetical protein [Chloroflexota bacterium]
MYDAIFAERLGTPTASLCNEGFANDALSAASGKGMPGVRTALETVPCECSVTERIVDSVRAAMGDVVAALSTPLTAEERSPRAKETESSGRIVYRGSVAEVNGSFYRSGWTDGLPVMPPTEEAVAEMLTGTALPRDSVVAEIIPRMGRASVEKIAVNAVMAGALPTHMPILIAAVQALMDPKAGFGTWEVSTGSWSPYWIVNGLIRRQIHVNSGSGALSPGDIANAAIGRAIGLIVKNIGGARKGIEDMGVQGNPGKYSMVEAENEEASPWQPLHVQQGFNKNESCVTVSFPNSFTQIAPYGTDDKGVLRGIISNVMPGRRGITLVLPPAHARTLADKGWTKQDIASYIAEYARVPAHRHPTYWGASMGGEKPRPPLDAQDPVALLLPDEIRIVVAGGPGAFMALIAGGRTWVTKKIELPANWEHLVEKYADVVPTYVKY